MKKILTVFAALAMVACLVSCNKENIAGNGNGEINKTTITATFAEPSKVTYSENGTDLQPSWEESDIVLGIASDGTPFKLTVVSINSYIATLEGENVPSGDVKLIYVSGVETTDYDTTNKKYVISYNAQNGDKTMPAIMTASGIIDNGSGEFEFYNDGAVLGISNVGTALNGKAIKQVTLYGKKLASSANVSYSGVTFNYVDGYNVISTKVLGDITVGEDGALDKNILMAVPAEAEVDSVFIRTTEGEVYSLGSSNKDPMSPSDYRYIKNANFKRDAYREAMILTGVFSVKDEDLNEKQVFFSKGNLWYGKVEGATEATFNFETNQYGYSETWSQDHVSHFFWSQSESVAYADTYNELGRAAADVFFTNATTETAKSDFTVNGVTGQYRTLTPAEWEYLFNTRAASTVSGTKNARYAKATVNSKAGIILLPDTYVHPSGVIGLTEINTGFADYTANSYDLTAWAKMEAAGAVFLPAAGFRDSFGIGGVGFSGGYWLSSAKGEYAAYSVFFNSFDVYPDNYFDRDNGCSVRLVTECK